MNLLYESHMKTFFLILTGCILFQSLTNASAATGSDSLSAVQSHASHAIYDDWVNKNNELAIIQQLPIPGREVFARKTCDVDYPTQLRLCKVIATNSSSISVGSIIIIETAYIQHETDVGAKSFYILDLEAGPALMIDGENVAYFFADNATCIRINNDKANCIIKKISEIASDIR